MLLDQNAMANSEKKCWNFAGQLLLNDIINNKLAVHLKQLFEGVIMLALNFTSMTGLGLSTNIHHSVSYFSFSCKNGK